MKLMTSMMAVAGMLMLMTLPAAADNFVFHVGEEGGWSNEFTQSEELIVTNEATFEFNGGAGTDGTSSAEGDFAFTGGLSGQFAGGEGNTYANTDGDVFAESEFASGAFVATGALAGDFAMDEISMVDVSGLVTAGGAGTAGTTTTFTSDYELSQNGEFTSDYRFRGNAR